MVDPCETTGPRIDWQLVRLLRGRPSETDYLDGVRGTSTGCLWFDPYIYGRLDDVGETEAGINR